MKHGRAQALKLRGVDAESRTATFVASTGALDSYDEVLDQKSWRLDRYRANPVVLFAHNDRDLPIGRTESIDINADGNLEFSMRFASAEANPKAEQVFQLMKADMLGGASVGFVADKAERVIENGKSFRRLTGLELFEISIVPVPANPETLAKMRARAVALANGEPLMTPEQIAQLAKALGLADGATAEDVFNAMIAKMGEEEPTEETPVAPEAAAEVAEATAAKAALLRATGAATVNAAVTQLEAFKRSHIALEEERGRLASERSALEGAERRSLVVELVKLGRETPATAWAKGADGLPDGKTPKGALGSMSLDELRERVGAFRATGPAQRGATPSTNDANTFAVGDGDPVTLTDREIAKCKAKGIDPKKYAETRAALRPRKAS